jgi:hypothetical protein
MLSMRRTCEGCRIRKLEWLGGILGLRNSVNELSSHYLPPSVSYNAKQPQVQRTQRTLFRQSSHYPWLEMVDVGMHNFWPGKGTLFERPEKAKERTEAHYQVLTCHKTITIPLVVASHFFC